MDKIGTQDNLDQEQIRAKFRFILRNTNIEIMIYSDTESTKEEKNDSF